MSFAQCPLPGIPPGSGQQRQRCFLRVSVSRPLGGPVFGVFSVVQPESPIVANLYLGEVEKGALSSVTGTAPNRWFRYVDDAGVKMQTKELEAFSRRSHHLGLCC